MLRVVRPSRLVVLFKLVYLSKQILLRREESDDRCGQGVGERRRAIGLVLISVTASSSYMGSGVVPVFAATDAAVRATSKRRKRLIASYLQRVRVRQVPGQWPNWLLCGCRDE